MSLSKPICEHCGRSLPASGAIRIHSANGQGGARWRCLECDSRILRRSHEEIAYYHAVERDQYMLWRLCLDVGTEADRHATTSDPRRALSAGNGLVRWRPLDQSTAAVAAERHPAAAACAADDRARWSDSDPDFDPVGNPDLELELDLDADDDDRAGRANLRCTCGGRRLDPDFDLDEADDAGDDNRPRRLATGLDAAGLAVLVGVFITLVLYLLTLYLTGVIH